MEETPRSKAGVPDPPKADGPGLTGLSEWFGPLRAGWCGGLDGPSGNGSDLNVQSVCKSPPPLKSTGLTSSAPWWPQEAMVQALCFSEGPSFPQIIDKVLEDICGHKRELRRHRLQNKDYRRPRLPVIR